MNLLRSLSLLLCAEHERIHTTMGAGAQGGRDYLSLIFYCNYFFLVTAFTELSIAVSLLPDGTSSSSHCSIFAACTRQCTVIQPLLPLITAALSTVPSSGKGRSTATEMTSSVCPAARVHVRFLQAARQPVLPRVGRTSCRPRCCGCPTRCSWPPPGASSCTGPAASRPRRAGEG